MYLTHLNSSQYCNIVSIYHSIKPLPNLAGAKVCVARTYLPDVGGISTCMYFRASSEVPNLHVVGYKYVHIVGYKYMHVVENMTGTRCYT